MFSNRIFSLSSKTRFRVIYFLPVSFNSLISKFVFIHCNRQQVCGKDKSWILLKMVFSSGFVIQIVLKKRLLSKKSKVSSLIIYLLKPFCRFCKMLYDSKYLWTYSGHPFGWFIKFSWNRALSMEKDESCSSGSLIKFENVLTQRAGKKWIVIFKYSYCSGIVRFVIGCTQRFLSSRIFDISINF